MARRKSGNAWYDNMMSTSYDDLPKTFKKRITEKNTIDGVKFPESAARQIWNKNRRNRAYAIANF